MNILEKLGLRSAPTPPVTHIAVLRDRVTNLARMTSGEFRNGMWVRLVLAQEDGTEKGSTGILRDCNEAGVADVMLVQEDGTNLLGTHVPITQLRQARRSEIPAARRPTKAEAARLGYGE